MSSRSLRALTLAAGLALLTPALAPAASLVQLSFTGTSSYTEYEFITGIPTTSGTEAYAASVFYDPTAAATATGTFPMSGYTGYNTGLALVNGEVQLQDNVTVAGFTDPVDVLTFTDAEIAFSGLPILIGNTITLTASADFLAGLQLPSLADFQFALANGKILAASANGGAVLFNPFGGGFGAPLFDYTASIDTVAAAEFTAVPTPAAALGALPLLATLAYRRSRRQAI